MRHCKILVECLLHQNFFNQSRSLINQSGIDLDQGGTQIQAPFGIFGIHNTAHADNGDLSIDPSGQMRKHRFTPHSEWAPA